MNDQTTFDLKQKPLLVLKLSKEEMKNLYYFAYRGIYYVYGGDTHEAEKNLLFKINECIKAGE